MKFSAFLCCSFAVVTFSLSIILTDAEIADHQESKPFQVLDKDLKNGKEKWIQNDEDWDWDNDMMQHPIDEGPRRTHRELGEMCTYSHDCQSGCCLLERKTKIRSCQPKAILGEKCSNAQVKADTYVDFCPCVSGYDHCSFPKEVCTK